MSKRKSSSKQRDTRGRFVKASTRSIPEDLDYDDDELEQRMAHLRDIGFLTRETRYVPQRSRSPTRYYTAPIESERSRSPSRYYTPTRSRSPSGSPSRRSRSRSQTHTVDEADNMLHRAKSELRGFSVEWGMSRSPSSTPLSPEDEELFERLQLAYNEMVDSMRERSRSRSPSMYLTEEQEMLLENLTNAYNELYNAREMNISRSPSRSSRRGFSEEWM